MGYLMAPCMSLRVVALDGSMVTMSSQVLKLETHLYTTGLEIILAVSQNGSLLSAVVINMSDASNQITPGSEHKVTSQAQSDIRQPLIQDVIGWNSPVIGIDSRGEGFYNQNRLQDGCCCSDLSQIRSCQLVSIKLNMRSPGTRCQITSSPKQPATALGSVCQSSTQDSFSYDTIHH